MYTTFQHNSKHYTYAGGVEALVVRGYITAGQIQFHLFRECVSTGAAGARTRRSLGHHHLHPLILRLLTLCAPSVLRPRALQDEPAPADPKF
jgi:hypothetical protein